MTEVLQSPSHFPSPSSSTSCAANDGPHQQQPHTLINGDTITIETTRAAAQEGGQDPEEEEEGQDQERERERKERDREGDQLSLLALLVTAFRKSLLIGCSISATGGKELCSMEIGLPTNVRHVAHVTFDRFNGFLGLPVEFEPEVPRRAPSASATVFGVSTESMQLSFDSRGNSVPTILLMMQRHLYLRGGLQAEGIFRINADNTHEEYVREQLNRGVVPDDIDVHCLAGLIKAWFRELPTGILDSLSPEQVMQSHSEDECVHLVRQLAPIEAALLDWAINLMADVTQMEHLNKMNARNVAMVFAPNMTQMSDPLTALMYAVQVMNFLKTLIIKTLREREDSIIDSTPLSPPEHSGEDGHRSSLQSLSNEANEEAVEANEEDKLFVAGEPVSESPSHPPEYETTPERVPQNFLTSIENIIPEGNRSLVDNCPCEVVSQVNSLTSGNLSKSKSGPSSNSNPRKGPKKMNERSIVSSAEAAEKRKGTRIVGRINSRTERVEAWR
ncbi:Rho GTPase activating protein with PAK-box/P21-Rho-binding domain [Tripterygium wilfordii]|uniref:Rho GTPase activating protein with PAK-box/P21-Rho-binding domain n=1 Tax=Tripterygium wilfordii TaxID=458696 RepID=A0A7J7DNC9_TRIWF|nr:rho GTPase-activating protein 5-like [Tripterygium wilfordii]KAF5747793.1 Rho GTPase activating protein with PAK-box/P21-Rho-binding domain [Tripterygium wilfordii]